MQPTLEFFRSILSYEPETGLLHWLNNRGRNKRKGKQAGWVAERGYIVIQVEGKQYAAHRVAWLLMTGEFPAIHIDHIDGVTSNNKWSNLRQATPSQNAQNRRLYKNNTSGHKGICYHPGKKKWIAVLRAKEQKLSKAFKELEQAVEWMKQARLAMHGEFARFS